MEPPTSLTDALLPTEIHPVLRYVLQIWSVTNSTLAVCTILAFLAPLHSRTKSIFLSVALVTRTLFVGLWLSLLAYKDVLDLIFNLDSLLHVVLTIVAYICCR